MLWYLEASYFIVEGELVDGYLVLARVALLGGREEGLREIEAGQPEHYWRPKLVPVLTTQNARLVNLHSYGESISLNTWIEIVAFLSRLYFLTTHSALVISLVTRFFIQTLLLRNAPCEYQDGNKSGIFQREVTWTFICKFVESSQRRCLNMFSSLSLFPLTKFILFISV